MFFISEHYDTSVHDKLQQEDGGGGGEGTSMYEKIPILYNPNPCVLFVRACVRACTQFDEQCGTDV